MIERRIRDINIASTPTITPGTSTTEAARLLRRADVPAVIVLEADAIAGMVTEPDIVAMVAEADFPRDVGSVTLTPVPTASPETTLIEAADTMREHGLRQLPVVEGTDYCGVVPVETLAPYLSRHRVDIDPDRRSIRVGVTDSAEIAISD
jgi:CBS domain-containing protein